jgi:hypothetical protein
LFNTSVLLNFLVFILFLLFFYAYPPIAAILFGGQQT